MNQYRRTPVNGPPPSWLRGSAYGLGMVAATVSGSAFIIGGIAGGATGWSAIMFAAIIPLAGLIWILVLSVHDGQNRQRYHRRLPPTHPHYAEQFDIRPRSPEALVDQGAIQSRIRSTSGREVDEWADLPC